MRNQQPPAQLAEDSPLAKAHVGQKTASRNGGLLIRGSGYQSWVGTPTGSPDTLRPAPIGAQQMSSSAGRPRSSKPLQTAANRCKPLQTAAS
eukprot:13384477-Alexandrium_andersonii.AAC.1